MILVAALAGRAAAEPCAGDAGLVVFVENRSAEATVVIDVAGELVDIDARDRCRGDADVCVPGVPRDCDDADPCTIDACADVVGCVHEPVVDLEAVTCRVARMRTWLAAPGVAGTRAGGALVRVVVRLERALAAVRRAHEVGALRTERRALGGARSALRAELRILKRARGLPIQAGAALDHDATEALARVEALRAALPPRGR